MRCSDILPYGECIWLNNGRPEGLADFAIMIQDYSPRAQNFMGDTSITGVNGSGAYLHAGWTRYFFP